MRSRIVRFQAHCHSELSFGLLYFVLLRKGNSKIEMRIGVIRLQLDYFRELCRRISRTSQSAQYGAQPEVRDGVIRSLFDCRPQFL